MFRLHKEISRLDIPAQRVLRLEHSLGDIQVALPGLPAQQATAYLCGFAAGQGLRVAVVLHLHSSGLLAFYLNDEGGVDKRDGTRIYNLALAFAQSMGFMFGDLDIHLKSPAERDALWRSLPLQSGVATPPPAPAPGESTRPARRAASGAKPAAPSPPVATTAGRNLRRPPAAADPSFRRKELLENLGRFLASF